jgi:hypothetical protein
VRQSIQHGGLRGCFGFAHDDRRNARDAKNGIEQRSIFGAQARDFFAQRALSACGVMQRRPTGMRVGRYRGVADRCSDALPKLAQHFYQTPSADVISFEFMRRVEIHSMDGKLTVESRPQINWRLVWGFPAWVTLVAVTGKAKLHLGLLGFIVSGVLIVSPLWSWIMNMTGKEVLEFTSTRITQRQGPFGLFWKITMKMEKIREPRFVEPRPGRAGLPTGLQFFYQRVSFQVLDGISEAQAKEIIAAVARQFPELAPVWGTLHGYWSGDNAGADFR